MLNLDSTPYSLDHEAQGVINQRIQSMEERVSLLRSTGTLTAATLRSYYGEKRFEQVAESNAIEGSTLSTGETELAVLKGITITGHDPAFIRDAVALDKALSRLTELAKQREAATTIDQIAELHGLILEGRPGAGLFRKDPVTIRGSDHRPPKTWPEVMKAMEDWEAWSQANKEVAVPIRATVLHAWLTHIHPYSDGNGRTARAVSNLELIRGGYPPIIVRKKERERYLQALADSDAGGDIRLFMELVLERIEGSLTGLEHSAKQAQGFDADRERIRRRQLELSQIWETSVSLLHKTIFHFLSIRIEVLGGICRIKEYETSLGIEDYIGLCERQSMSRSWAFSVEIAIPGFPKLERLAYFGYRSPSMYHHLGDEGGPSIYWSRKNHIGFPKWISDDQSETYGVEMTTRQGSGDEWYVRRPDDSIMSHSTTDLAREVASSLINTILSPGKK